MKTKLLVIYYLLFLSVCSYGQIGVKAGVDFSSLTTSSSKSEVGFHVGAGYDLQMSKKFYFQPGLLFTSNGFKFETNEVVKKANVSIYALEIPLVFSFRPMITDNAKFLLDFGLYGRYGLFGKKKYEYFISEPVNESPFDVYNRLDWGFNFGIGYNHKNIFFSAISQIGLNNAEKEIDNFHHKKLRLSLGYMF